MGDLFYFFGLLISWTNFIWISKLFEFHKINFWAITFEKVSKNPPKKEDFPNSQWEIFNAYSALSVITIIWFILGLLTQSWKFYFLTISILFLINWVIKKRDPFSLFGLILIPIKGLIICLIPTLMTINHFHLHLDIWALIFG